MAWLFIIEAEATVDEAVSNNISGGGNWAENVAKTALLLLVFGLTKPPPPFCWWTLLFFLKLFDDDGDEPELLLLEEELKSLLRNEFFRSKLLLLFEDDAADAAGEAVVGNVDGAPDVGSEAAVAEAGSSSCTCFNADAASFLERRSDPPNKNKK